MKNEKYNPLCFVSGVGSSRQLSLRTKCVMCIDIIDVIYRLFNESHTHTQALCFIL
jgi:hypothetical protein